MSQHCKNGAILKHHLGDHNRTPNTDELVENCKILHKGVGRADIMLLESLYIKDRKPFIKRKDEGIVRTLKIF